MGDPKAKFIVYSHAPLAPLGPGRKALLVGEEGIRGDDHGAHWPETTGQAVGGIPTPLKHS